MKEKGDEILLLNQIYSGNELAFKQLFDLYFIPLCRYINLLVQDERNAEEIALDIFISIWEKRENIQIQTNVNAYLFRMAKNRALNYLRDNEKNITYESLLAIEKASVDDLSMEYKELEQIIEDSVCILPEKCREVFIKSRMDNLTNKEIAAQMNVTLKTVEAQITKALKMIRKYVDKSYDFSN